MPSTCCLLTNWLVLRTWNSYTHLHSTYSVPSISTPYLWWQPLVNGKALGQTALVLTHMETMKAKEHQSAMAMEPKWKKRRNKRRIGACHGNVIFLLCILGIKNRARYTEECQTFRMVSGYSLSSQLLKILKSQNWHNCPMKSHRTNFSSQLCSFHLRAQQIYSMWQWGKKQWKPISKLLAASVPFPFWAKGNRCETTKVWSLLKNQIPHKRVDRTPLNVLNSRTSCYSKLQEFKMCWVTQSESFFYFHCSTYNGIEHEVKKKAE